MNASTPSQCPECGKPIPAGRGICPACLLKQAIVSRTLDDGPREMPPAPPPEEIAEHFPQYEILECLGRGGMGAVYRARQKSLNRMVAIKVLAPERGGDARFAERFAREAELLAKLSHPNIVTVHDFGEAGGHFHLVMEHVDGVNLRELMRAGKMPPEQALAIVPPICEALQYAHERGIVHRDIKPENLLLDREGRVKIADFGIAALAGDAAERAGTPAYMAPEQAGEGAAADHRADIYALGAVLYEMLTGERPTTSPVPPSRQVRIDVRLDEVVLRALEHEPERRYQTAADFRTGVDGVSTSAASGPAPWTSLDLRSAGGFLGLPWVHVTSGVDPATGRRRIARGWLAIGDRARGVVAFGGEAVGVFAFGGAAFGAVAFGGIAAGAIACGGLGIGVLSIAGFAVGGGAVGGTAAGHYAFGGEAIGTHVLEPGRRDPAALAFFEPWAPWLLARFAVWNSVILGIGMGVLLLVPAWLRRRPAGHMPPPPPAADGRRPPLLLHFAPALLLAAAWLTSGLEKGAVLILSVLVVAVLVLQFLLPVRRKFAMAAAFVLLAAGFIGGALMLSRGKDAPPAPATADVRDGETSLQARLDAAPPHAVIHIPEGTWHGRIRIERPVTLVGAGWDKTRIVAEGPRQEDDESHPGRFQPVIDVVAGSGEVRLSGLSVTMTGRPREGALLPPPLLSLQGGIATVEDCGFIGSVGNGIVVKNADAEISRCLIAATWNTGVVVGDFGSLTLRDSVVRNCHYAGVSIGKQARPVSIRGCEITGSAWHGIRYDDTSPEIAGNLIHGNERTGIYASGDTAGTVTGNRFVDDPVTLWFQARDKLVRNRFDGGGVKVLGRSSPEIRANVFRGAGIGQSLIGGDTPAARSYGSPVVEGNAFDGVRSRWQRGDEAVPLPPGNHDGTTAPGVGPETDPAPPEFPLQPEETAIIPDGDSRDSRQWRLPK